MELFLDCLPCLLRQSLEAARLVTDDEDVQARILEQSLTTLTGHASFSCAPALAQDIHAIIRHATGEADPYRDIKRRDMEAARDLLPLVSGYVGTGEGALLRALKVAATGNLMDSALLIDLDITACIEQELERQFARCDLGPLADDLADANTVLIIGDNAGEAVFDTVLAGLLARDHEVVFAVRDAPIINDVTAREATAVGMDAVARVVSTGCRAPGTILDSCTDEFRALFESADVVISKGQGNFEALAGCGRPVYFLLKAKCSKVARFLGVDLGDSVLALMEPAADVAARTLDLAEPAPLR